MEENTIPSVFDEIALDRPFFEYATVGQRFLNFIIDVAVYYLLYILVIFLAAIAMAYSGVDSEDIQRTFADKLILYPISYVVYTIMYLCMEGLTKGLTVGKLITRTRAVKEDLSPITWKDAFVRTMIRLIPVEAFSAFSGYPWHDKWSKTLVIKKARSI